MSIPESRPEETDAAPADCTVAVVCRTHQRDEVVGELARRGLNPIVLPGGASSLLALGSDTPDGSLSVCDVRGAVQRGDDAAPVRFSGTVADVTRRRRTEEALQESEDRFRALAENSPDSVDRLDRGFRHVYINGVAAAVVGKAPEEVIGKTNREIGVPDATATLWEDRLRKVFDTGEPLAVEDSFPTPGGIRFFDTRCVPERWGDGKVQTVLAVSRDTTARRQLEEAWRHGEERYRAMFEHAIDGVFQTSVPGKALAANPAFVRMLGYASEEDVLNTLTDLPHGLWAHPDERAKVSRLIAEHGHVRGYECEFLRKDGTGIWISLNAAAVCDADGRMRYFHGSIQDITGRRRAEEERARLEAQLQQAHKMESVGRLAGGVAHDFNNMLAVIMGHAELALQQVDAAQPLHADLTGVLTAATRSAGLVRQLLAFARRQAVAPRVIDLNETVSGALDMLGRLIGEGIHLTWRPAPEVWPVRIDPAQIDQILANLCVNARDAIGDAGTIAVATRNGSFDEAALAAFPGVAAGACVQLIVADDGCGIDEETLRHIFEPFFTTKGVGEGIGMGLASVYGAVTQNGGTITVRSQMGGGTAFTISLPRHEGAVERPRGDTASDPAARGRETILLVEDEALILKMATAALARQGYTVLAAGAPGDALRLAQEHAGLIDLLVTDVVMPEMNGQALAERLRAIRPGLRCVFMSGYPADVVSHHGVMQDGAACLQKPFSMGELAAKVREALARA